MPITLYDAHGYIQVASAKPADRPEDPGEGAPRPHTDRLRLRVV